MRVFVSHSTQDVAVAQGLIDHITTHRERFGIHDVAYSSGSPESGDGPAVATNWTAWIRNKLEAADVVLFLSSHSSRSGWAAAELGVAMHRDKRILGVIGPDGYVNNVLATRLEQFANISDGDEKVIEALVALGSVDRFPVPDTVENPYPGLRPVNYPGLLFGRDADIKAVIEKLVPDTVVLLTGPSGAGKSSVVAAGILPRLERDGLTTAVIRPSDRAGLRAEVDVLAIDQAEELSTIADTREPILALIADQIGRGGRVLISARAEFVETIRHLLARETEDVYLDFISPDQIHAVIEEPAAQLGYWVPPELTRKLVSDVRSGSMLPLLAYALTLMWETRDKSTKRLLLSSWEKLAGPDEQSKDPTESAGSGYFEGIRGLMYKHAKKTLERDHADASSQKFQLAVLARLATTSLPTTRLPLDDELLTEAERDVLQRFVEARLTVTRSTTPVGESDGRGEEKRLFYEATHDVLFGWPKLNAAISNGVYATESRRTIDEAALRLDAGSEDSLVNSDLRKYAKQNELLSVPLIKRLIGHSKRQGSMRRVAPFAAIAAVVSVPLLALAYLSLLDAQTNERRADAAKLASNALEQIGSDRDHAAFLAVSAVDRDRTPAARGSVLSVIAEPAGPVRVVRSNSEASTPEWEGTRLLASGQGVRVSGPRQVALVNLETDNVRWLTTKEEISLIRIEEVRHETVAMVAQQDAGSFSVAITLDTAAEVWKRYDHVESINALDVAGPMVAVGDVSGGVFVASEGGQLERLGEMSDQVVDVVIAPDGSYVAATDLQEAVAFRRLEGGAWSGARSLPGPPGLQRLAFRPGEVRQLFGAGAGGSVHRWDLDVSTASRTTIGRFPATVNALEFDPNGEVLFAAGDAAQILRWELSDVVRQLPSVDAHQVPVDELTASSSTRMLTTAEAAVVLWDLAPQRTVRIDEDAGGIAKTLGGSIHEVHVSLAGEVAVDGSVVGTFEELRFARRLWELRSDSADGAGSVLFEVSSEPQLGRGDAGWVLLDLGSGVLTDLGLPDDSSPVQIDASGCLVALAARTRSAWTIDVCGEPVQRSMTIPPSVSPSGDEANESIEGVAVSATGKVAVVQRSRLREFDSAGEPGRVLDITPDGFASVATSVKWLDADRVLVGFDQGRDISVFDLRDGAVTELAGHTDAVWLVELDEAQGRFLTGGEDGLIRLWDTEALEPLGRPLVGRAKKVENDENVEIRGMFISQDGNAATVLHGTEIVRWDLNEDSWVRRACWLAGPTIPAASRDELCNKSS